MKRDWEFAAVIITIVAGVLVIYEKYLQVKNGKDDK
jgi:hypothetical protein